MGDVPRCAVCGRALPNKWAIGGACAEDGCEAVFCVMHYRKGNKKCPKHGWAMNDALDHDHAAAADAPELRESETPEEVKLVSGASECNLLAEAKRKLSASDKLSILGKLGAGAASLGAEAMRLVKEFRGIHDPEDAIRALNAQLAANRSRREPLAARHEELRLEIAAKRQQFEAAPPERQHFVEMELRQLQNSYESEERQLKIYLENELAINAVRCRTLELVAMGLRTVKEMQVDNLADKINGVATDAERVAMALRDLDKAGRQCEEEAAPGEALGESPASVPHALSRAAVCAAPGDVAPTAEPTPAPEPRIISGF